MIIFDSSEKSGKSDKVIKNMKYQSWIEAETGADVIVSPLDDIPLNRGTLLQHMASGAVLIQIKHESDLVASIGERMNECIARMIPITRFAWQRQLVPVGLYHHGESDHVQYSAPTNRAAKPYWIKAQPPKSFQALQSAIWRWIKRGGVFVPFIHNRKELGHYLEREQIDLIEMSQSDKIVFPSLPAIYDDPREDDPLQQVQIIDDGRTILAAFPGIGQQRAQDLWDYDGGKLFMSIMRLTSPGVNLPKGIGKKTVENVRTIMGFTDDDGIWEFTIQQTPKSKRAEDRIQKAMDIDD